MTNFNSNKFQKLSSDQLNLINGGVDTVRSSTWSVCRDSKGVKSRTVTYMTESGCHYGEYIYDDGATNGQRV